MAQHATADIHFLGTYRRALSISQVAWPYSGDKKTRDLVIVCENLLTVFSSCIENILWYD